MTQNKTLTDLNKILFQTLEDLASGNSTPEKANAITGVSAQLINSAKVQLQAFKLTKGSADISILSEQDKAQLKLSQGKDAYDLKRVYAIDVLGYKSLSAAVSALGNYKFNNDFKKYKETN